MPPSRPRILLVTSVLPWPLRRNGGAQRTELVRRTLAAHGSVEIVAVGGKELRDEGLDDSALAGAGVVGCFERQKKALAPRPVLRGPLRGVGRLLADHQSRYTPDAAAAGFVRARHMAAPYDLVVSRYLQPALQCDLLSLDGAAKLLDFDDMDDQALAAALAGKPWPGLGGKLGGRLLLRSVRRICRDAARSFDHVFCTTPADANALPGARTSVLPNIPFSPSPGESIVTQPPADASRRLLFIGDLQFPPNRDGLDRFLSRVWPAVRAKVPTATLAIVGRGLSDADRARWSAVDGADVVGYADDLSACYAQCALTVVPIYFGGGTKIKVLESLAFGRCVVLTPQAANGYDVLTAVRTTPVQPAADHTPAIAVAADDAAFAGNCIDLLNDPARRQRMAAAGQTLLAAHFSFDRFRDTVDQAIKPLLAARRPAARRPV